MPYIIQKRRPSSYFFFFFSSLRDWVSRMRGGIGSNRSGSGFNPPPSPPTFCFLLFGGCVFWAPKSDGLARETTVIEDTQNNFGCNMIDGVGTACLSSLWGEFLVCTLGEISRRMRNIVHADAANAWETQEEAESCEKSLSHKKTFSSFARLGFPQAIPPE